MKPDPISGSPPTTAAASDRPKFEAVHPVLMSRDVVASIAFYQALGFTLQWQDDSTAPKYAAVRRDSVELHLQWHDPKAWERVGDRPVYRILVRDVEGLYRECRAQAIITDMKGVFDSSWGTREFHLRDPDLNGLQFCRPR